MLTDNLKTKINPPELKNSCYTPLHLLSSSIYQEPPPPLMKTLASLKSVGLLVTAFNRLTISLLQIQLSLQPMAYMNDQHQWISEFLFRYLCMNLGCLIICAGSRKVILCGPQKVRAHQTL